MTEILILGAGMAGLGAALALQARGQAVTVVDRRAPGEETSFGNAGVIQAEAMEPYALPRDLATLWRYATGRSNDVVWHLRELPHFAPALLAYFRHSAPRRHAKIGRTYARLIARVRDDHGRLIDAAGAGNLIARNGLGEVYRDPRAFDAAARQAEALAARYGLAARAFSGAELRRAEPAIRADLAGAWLWEDSWSCFDPGGLVTSYADLFARRGGRLLRGEAETLARDGAAWRIETEAGAVEAAEAVVALGPWSGTFLARFGYRPRLVLKGGYHTHLRMAGSLTRPYLDADNGVVLAPMHAGLRLTTGAELIRPGRTGSPRQLLRGRRAAAELVELRGDPDGPPPLWQGHRPCLADMLPLVGPAPRHSHLWFHFGHGHQGFTLGPTTGEVLAAMMAGESMEDLADLLPAGRL